MALRVPADEEQGEQQKGISEQRKAALLRDQFLLQHQSYRENGQAEQQNQNFAAAFAPTALPGFVVAFGYRVKTLRQAQADAEVLNDALRKNHALQTCHRQHQVQRVRGVQAGAPDDPENGQGLALQTGSDLLLQCQIEIEVAHFDRQLILSEHDAVRRAAAQEVFTGHAVTPLGHHEDGVIVGIEPALQLVP